MHVLSDLRIYSQISDLRSFDFFRKIACFRWFENLKRFEKKQAIWEIACFEHVLERFENTAIWELSDLRISDLRSERFENCSIFKYIVFSLLWSDLRISDLRTERFENTTIWEVSDLRRLVIWEYLRFECLGFENSVIWEIACFVEWFENC